ncbi:MAG: hypothetical protein SVJ22_05815 [Halobacteriota archaeon]|nr:hypothetical protein [Halobacteriota archaeon]
MDLVAVLIDQGFSVPDAISTLKPFIVFVMGMVVYSVIIFKSYRFLAKKDIFRLKYDRYVEEELAIKVSFKGALFYIFKYTFLFPLIAFSGFLFLSVLLILLSEDQSVSSILLISMAVVSAIRITAYYNEDLSRDLAKMLPFALLGVFIVDASFLSFSSLSTKITEMQEAWKPITYYLFFIIGLELVLRLGNEIVSTLRHEEKSVLLE